MSSSLLNGRHKMLFKLSIVLTIFATIKTGSATDLVDLPLKINSKSANIHATLTDADGTDKYFIQESISASGRSIKGKIVISGEKDSYNVHYNTESYYNKDRLVIHGTNCLSITFKNNWDQTLPGLKKPVTNLILLMGPSILYRLDHVTIVWKSVADKNIRGTMMKGATAEINKRLKITYYYKTHFDEDSGIKNPSRIEFSGYDPSSFSYGTKENLILDIYLQNENYNDELANEVQPLPGIGCIHYLSTSSTPFPRLKVNYVHYIMYESIEGSTSTQTYSEIHASNDANLLRLKATLLGATTEAVYDYNLGVSYLFQKGGSCSILSGDMNSPGISNLGYFSLQSLLLLDSTFNYLGKLNFEHRSGFPVDAWESIRYNVNINGKKVDKAVITQYFAKSPKSEIFIGYTLVGTTIAIYKLDPSSKTYTLTDGITRDYMNFETAGSEDELHDIFSLKECKYLSSDKTLSIVFKLRPEYYGTSSNKLTEIQAYELKKDFLYSVILRKNISPLRVDTVDYTLNEAQIEVAVTFLDSPNLQYIFNSKAMSVSAETFKKMKTIKAINEYECLEKLSKYRDTIIVVIYKPTDSSCGYLTNFDDLKEDAKIGEPCSIYHFPLHNLRRIGQELPLDKIHSTFLQDVGDVRAYFVFDSFKRYELIDVIDTTKNQGNSAGAFQTKLRSDAKLKRNDQNTVTVPDVKTFTDCYRTCHNSDQLKCNTFSFCRDGECRVSSLSSGEAYNDTNVEQDTKCSVYVLEVLNDYREVRQRKFKAQTSIAVNKGIYDCAEFCHASPDCFSFQWCDYSCSFGGYYTDSATEYDGECNVYFPKVSEKYQKTGNKIVSDRIHTEMNLNFEQCAALCHGWSDGDTGCKSFNYCPKSRTASSCTLTQFSVKSPDTKTTEEGDCSNYELKGESNRKKSSSTAVTKGTSGSGAFGIIMLFLFVGAILGFAAPIGYSKVKQMRNASIANESFTWTRQVDERAENIN